MKKISEDRFNVMYLHDVKDDKYIHFTTPEIANEIVKSGKLLMDPPHRKFGTDTVNAVSLAYGEYVPNVQHTHRGDVPIVAILFSTDTIPKIGFIEEVAWKTDVNLIDPKIISHDDALNALKASNEIEREIDEYGDPKDLVVYYTMPSELMESTERHKYKGFLQSLRTTENSSLVESISKAFQLIFESVNYPAGFDINEFSQLSSFAARKRYAAERLQKLGEGSSRIVYGIDNETVLKMAKNKKGLAQNQVEADWGMHQMYSDLLPDLIEADDNDLWLVKQRANRIKKSEFERMTGFKFEQFGNALRLRTEEIMGRNRHAIPEEYEDILDDEFVGDVVSLIVDFDLEVGDMAAISNWGKLSDEGDPVLTDVGLNRSVYKEHYGR